MENINVEWLRAWMAEAVWRVVSRGRELWQVTETGLLSPDFDHEGDMERWSDEIDRVGLQVELELRERLKHSTPGTEQILVAIREMATTAGLQLRYTLDGVVLSELIPFGKWSGDYWVKGRLSIPPDPVAVTALIEARVASLVDALRAAHVAIPGLEAYLAEVQGRSDRVADVVISGSQHDLTVETGGMENRDSGRGERLRVRRLGWSVVLEIERLEPGRWTDLGAIPLESASSYGHLLLRLHERVVSGQGGK